MTLPKSYSDRRITVKCQCGFGASRDTERGQIIAPVAGASRDPSLYWCFIAYKLPNKDFDSSWVSLKCCPHVIVSFFRSRNMRVFLNSPSSSMSRMLCGFNPWRGPNKTYSDVSLVINAVLTPINGRKSLGNWGNFSPLNKWSYICTVYVYIYIYYIYIYIPLLITSDFESTL